MLFQFINSNIENPYEFVLRQWINDSQRSLMLRIKDYIHQRLSDPALGPAEIAAAVNISTHYLHKLFEADRRAVSLYIKGLRLGPARSAGPAAGRASDLHGRARLRVRRPQRLQPRLQGSPRSQRQSTAQRLNQRVVMAACAHHPVRARWI
jgi:hypothetical protein